MRIMVGLIAAASIGILSSALAMEPPVSTSQATSETTPPAKESTPSKTDSASPTVQSATPVTTDNVKLTAGDSEAAAQLKRFKAAGYKAEVHDGNVVFCRRETVLGSRFDKKVCTTAHLLEQQMAQAQDTLATAQRNSTITPRGN